MYTSLSWKIAMQYVKWSNAIVLMGQHQDAWTCVLRFVIARAVVVLCSPLRQMR